VAHRAEGDGYNVPREFALDLLRVELAQLRAEVELAWAQELTDEIEEVEAYLSAF
jgi:hypothetical protein